ncbi:SDR family NAD(P)-dependent oxidoreductase [Candidatus Acetothermia bacterium]|nr:SDR family NAD(P)-dependent oxidoreductase [Candidatus Acetothermia bacterium]
MKTLENKVAIVTGAGSGIGREVAIKYAAEGAKVVVADIDEKGGNETVSLIRKNSGEATFIKSDSSKPSECQSLVEQTVKRYGGLQVACNNAGIGGPSAPTGEYPIDAWDKVISINLSGVFYGMRYQIPAMLKSNGGTIDIENSENNGYIARATADLKRECRTKAGAGSFGRVA